MFSQDPALQKTQMEALASDVEDALVATTAITVTSATRPTQAAIQSGYFAADELIAPSHRIVWYDGKYIRGEIGTIRDFLLPLTASNKLIPGDVQLIRGILWRNRVQYFMTGDFYTTTTGTTEARTHTYYLNPDSTDLWPNAVEEVVSVNANSLFTGEQVLTVTPAHLLRKGAVSGTPSTTTSTSINVGAARPVVAVFDDNRSFYFRDTANPTNVQKRTPSTTSTIYTGFTDLANIYFDSTTGKLILIANVPPSTTSSAWRLDTNGTNLTQIIPAGVYAAGYFKTGYKHVGVEVRDGKIYAPVPGSPYLTTRRVYDILTGTYVDEEFDFHEARAALGALSDEARDIVENAQGALTQQRAYFGADAYAYVFERILDIQRSPDGTADLLTYEIGLTSPNPGATAGMAWAILPHDGVSGKLYPLTEAYDPRGDWYVVKEFPFDTATKEMNADWSDIDLTDFDSFRIMVDNGLTTATETIRFQFNGDTSSSYAYTFYRAAVAVVSNSTASAAFLDLYGINTTTVLGGKYSLTFVDHLSGGAVVNCVIEGSTASGVTTGLVNSILGMGAWTNPVPGSRITSVRIFLSGATAFFAANAKIQIIALRTKGVYN